MKQALLGLFVIQFAVLVYLAVNNGVSTAEEPLIEINVGVITPDYSNERVTVSTPDVPREEEDPFNFDIPDGRLVTEGMTKGMVELDKNINALGTLGEAFVENPIILRGLEKAIREQFYNFYGDFVREADLTPEEQIELFKIMSETMQNNLKSFMTELGKDTSQMQRAFVNGPPPELLTGIMDNNLAMKDSMISTMGQEKFELFEQYHKEKSAAESFNRLKRRLEREKTPLSKEQEDDLRTVFVDNQASPFQDTSYTEQGRADMSDKTGDILNEKQQSSFKKSRKRMNRTLLMPF